MESGEYYLNTIQDIFLTITTTYDRAYRELPINTNKTREFGAFTEILEAIYNQLEALLSWHSRITVLVFDLHLPYSKISGHESGNQLVTLFLKKIKEDLASARWGGHTQIIHGWAREVGKGGRAHYHFYIGFKQLYRRVGAISESGCTGLWKLIQNRWSEVSGGFARPSNSHTVNRSNPHELERAFHHLSYIAKIRDKDFGTGETHKRYSRSRLKPKPDDGI